MAESVSFASAFFTNGSIAGSAPPASSLAAAKRAPRSGETSLSAASALPSSRRRPAFPPSSRPGQALRTRTSPERKSALSEEFAWMEKGPPQRPLAYCRQKKELLGDDRLAVGFVLLLVVAGDERAPGFCLHRARGLPYHVELAVGFHFADEHRLVQVVVLRIHHRGDPRGRFECLPGHRGDHIVDVGGLRLLDRLFPHVDPDPSRLHRVVGEGLAR